MNIIIPEGSDIRTSMVGGASIVIVRPKPSSPMAPAPGISGYLHHDPGAAWPDTVGVALASALLECGEGVAFRFANLADALSFRKRLGAA